MTSVNATAAGKVERTVRRRASPQREPSARTMTRTARVNAAIVAILSRQGSRAVTVYELHRQLFAQESDCPALSTIYRHIRRLEASGRLAVDATRIGGRPMLGYRLASNAEGRAGK